MSDWNGEISPTLCEKGTETANAAFCGIGNPAGFEHTLATCGYNVVARREFPDHHAFDAHDVDSLEQWATEAGAAAVVCTHKDLVKIGRTRLGELPLWAVTVALEITAGRAELEARLEKFLPVT
jgi:tetraacyldisaccharide 4'-kinase